MRDTGRFIARYFLGKKSNHNNYLYIYLQSTSRVVISLTLQLIQHLILINFYMEQHLNLDILIGIDIGKNGM